MSMAASSGSWFDGATLVGALLAAALGTIGLLVYLGRRDFDFALPGQWTALLRWAQGIARRASGPKEPQAAEAPPEELPAPRAKDAPEFAAAMLASSQPACPPELSRRIDRIEEKLKARSAKRDG